MYEYDILGRMVQSEMPQEKKDGGIQYQKTTTGYDNTGNVTEKEEQIDGDRIAKTEYTYDKQGSLVMVKNCLDGDKAQYVQYVYDIQGNKVRQFIGMTAPLTLTVSEVTDAANDADTFSYAGKTYQLTVSGKKKTDTVAETKYEYDGKNQLRAYTDPEGRRETYTYDVNSNRIKTVDKNGNTQKNTYDYQNRLTEAVAKEKKTGKETKHTYTYNAYGDVATQDDTAFAYEDASGQVTKETTKLTKKKDVVKNYTYDSAGNKSVFTVKVVDYDYDTDGNLSERTVPGNNMTTTYTYDYQNHLTAMKNQTGSTGVISQYTSEYLANGQKSKETSDIADKDGKKSKKTATYTYDLLGRITKETKTGSRDISYTYDSNNNRKEMRVDNKVTAYKYNKNDELLRTDTLNTDTKEDSVVIYKNDKNGNQLATVNRYEIPSDKKDKTYIDIDVTLGDNRLNENVVNHYNAENQLTQTLTKNYKVSFTYDAEGLRTSKTVNGEKTVFVLDEDQLVMELSNSGKVKKRYVRGNDRGYGSNLVYVDKGTGTEKQFYVTDSHGNVVQLTDESGKVTKTYEYDSFGNEVKPDSKDENPFRYCGEYYDKETGEVYLRARYYQPAVGRFLTRDTYTGENDDPMSLHLYAYCGNDGVNAWDPSGHKKSYRTKLYSVSGHNCYLVSKKKWKGGSSKKSKKWNKFAQKYGLFEYFTGNMDIDCDGSGKPKDYGYEAHSSRQPETSVTYSNGDYLNAFETKYFVVHPKKHIGSKYGAQSGKRSPGIVWDTINNKKVYAMVGDTGPGNPNHIGEASAKVFDEFGYKYYNKNKKIVNDRWYGQGVEAGTQFRYVLSIAPSRPNYSVKTANKKIDKKGKKLYKILKAYGYTTAKSLKE